MGKEVSRLRILNITAAAAFVVLFFTCTLGAYFTRDPNTNYFSSPLSAAFINAKSGVLAVVIIVLSPVGVVYTVRLQRMLGDNGDPTTASVIRRNRLCLIGHVSTFVEVILIAVFSLVLNNPSNSFLASGRYSLLFAVRHILWGGYEFYLLLVFFLAIESHGVTKHPLNIFRPLERRPRSRPPTGKTDSSPMRGQDKPAATASTAGGSSSPATVSSPGSSSKSNMSKVSSHEDSVTD